MSLLALILLSNCASISIPDSEFCGDMGSLGASCFTVISEKNRDIEKEPWDLEREGMICTTHQTFGDWKAIILKLCHDNKKCKKEDVQSLENFTSKIDSLKIDKE